MNAIEVSGLAKKYGRFEALRGVYLSVGRGEEFGLVEPNQRGRQDRPHQGPRRGAPLAAGCG